MKRLFFLSLSLCLLAFTFTYKNARVVQGIVTDALGKPIEAASVQVKGTRTGTITDSAGNFSITVTNEKAVLIVSALAFTPMEVAVEGRNNLSVALKPAMGMLDEVVVTRNYMELQGKVPGISVHGANKAKMRGANGYFASPAESEYQPKPEADAWRYNGNFNTESYDHITDNPYLKTSNNPLSTFSIDVDAASYSNVRRMINDGQLPPPGAVRIEEMINYFSYEYPQPKGSEPFSLNTEIAAAPWNAKHQLVLIGLQGKKIPYDNLPATNLVFLVDVSGSMQDARKLPLVQASLKLLTDQLRPQDKVAIVVYAGNAGLVLPATSGAEKKTIKNAVDKLEAGGSTAGGAGIQLAYKVAKENFVSGGNNRVILCTDGDFNVGTSSDDELQRLIEQERQSGVFLTVQGYGMGNYQDSKMQKLADKGNGNHAYIDGLNEAKKVLVNEFGGTLFTIAKDVKLQIEFNPAKVQAYRLIGYENRMLAKEDFNNDKKDAGDMGSGHTVTALYEIIPVGVHDVALDSVDALRYQKDQKPQPTYSQANEIMNIKLRYKQPASDVSSLLQHPLLDNTLPFSGTSENFRFAAAVAQFGMLLRNSSYKGAGSFSLVTALAKNAMGKDAEGYRREFLQMVENAALLQGNKETAQAE